MPNLLKTEGSADGRDIIVYAGTVIDAFFTENEYGQSLGIRSRLDDTDLLNFPWMESGEHTRYFKLGKIQSLRGQPRIAWQILDDGASVKGDTDDRMFRADSDIGRLIDQIAGLLTTDDFDPRVASYWKQLGHVTWGEVTVTKSMPTGEKVADKSGTMRDEFKPTPVKMVLPTAIGGGIAPAAPIEQVDLSAYSLTEIQKDALATLHGTATTDAQFTAGAFAIDGIMGNAEFVKVLNGNVAGVRDALPI